MNVKTIPEMSIKQFYIKIHKQPDGQVVAACDKEILGKTFSNGNLKITISEQFYKGELKQINEVLDILSRCDNFNIAGNYIVNEAINNKIISKESILIIESIPIAMKLII